MDIKALKLSRTMIDAIINAERAESTTEPGHWLLLPVGRDATMRALESRGLAERGNGASGYSLTSDGRDVHEAMVPASEDHPTESDMITDALPVRTPGAFMGAQSKAEIAEGAATVADYIDAELDMALIFAEVSRAIEETFDNDRLMHLTPKGVFVSQGYVNTMRRIAAQRAFSRQEWREYQGVVQAQSGEAFKTIDQWVADGKISFRMADKQKRIIRNISRPSMLKGRKHKASKSR